MERPAREALRANSLAMAVECGQALCIDGQHTNVGIFYFKAPRVNRCALGLLGLARTPSVEPVYIWRY